MLILVIFGNTTGVISKLLFIINFVLITRAMEFMGFIYYNGFIIGEFEKKNDLKIISTFIIINFYYVYEVYNSYFNKIYCDKFCYV